MFKHKKNMIIETHPFLKLGKILNASRLILGSYPVYSITLPDNEEKKKIRDEKRLSRMSISIDKLSNPDNNKSKIGLRSTNFNRLFDDNLFD